MTTRILCVCASLREHSYTRRLLEEVIGQAKEFGGEGRLLDLRATPLPMFDPDDGSDEPACRQATEQVEWADAFVLGTPDYHGSMSGAMKNFLDYYWREFMGKLFGYVVSSHEKGLTVQDQMRTAVRQCYGWSLPYGVGFNGKEEFDRETGLLASERTRLRIRMLSRDMVVYGRLLRDQFQADLARDPRDEGFARIYKT